MGTAFFKALVSTKFFQATRTAAIEEKEEVVNGNCGVVGCTSSRYEIKVWEMKECNEHKYGIHKDCPRAPLFDLHAFPSLKLISDKRKELGKEIENGLQAKVTWSVQNILLNLDKRPILENPSPSLGLRCDRPVKSPEENLLTPIPKVPITDII